MTVQLDTIKMAWREGRDAAVAKIKRDADAIIRRAERAHDDGDYDAYEAHEEIATMLNELAASIKRMRYRP